MTFAHPDVRRPEMDAVIGAYSGQYDRGMFMTTAGYARQARAKATVSLLLHVDIIDGHQVAEQLFTIGGSGDAPEMNNWRQEVSVRAMIHRTGRRKEDIRTPGVNTYVAELIRRHNLV